MVAMVDETKYLTRIAPFGVRMPPSLKARVEAAAKANNRSMNMEIVAVLEEKFPDPAAALDMVPFMVRWMRENAAHVDAMSPAYADFLKMAADAYFRQLSED